MNMKKFFPIVLIGIAAVGTASAAGPLFAPDFDGRNRSAGTVGAGTALPGVKPAVAKSRGDIPEVPPPTCVGDDCDGQGGGQPYPQPNPQPNPHPNPWPTPQPNPQPWTPPSQPVPAPVPFSPSEDFYKKPFIASFCLAKADGATDCRRGNGGDVARSIEEGLRKDIVEELIKNGITIVFPGATGPAEVYGALKTALQHGIDLLATSMQADLDQLVQDMDGNGWGTPTDKARKMRIIIKNEQLIKLWKTAALLEAESGRNWKMGFSKPNSYKFIGGPAYEKLREGLLAKEIFTGQRRDRKPAR